MSRLFHCQGQSEVDMNDQKESYFPLPEGAEINVFGDSEIAIVLEKTLSTQQRETFIEHLKESYPGKKFLILPAGSKVIDFGGESRLKRIEAKLDALILALSDDEQGDEPQFTLDGEAVPSERDQDEML